MISLGSIKAFSLYMRAIQDMCHNESVRAGWHINKKTGKPFTLEEYDDNFPRSIALCHSELSEALEGHRKKMNDDHIVHRKMAEVELADAVIRICDLAGSMGYDLGTAIYEKLEYNRERQDHKVENRDKEGGKAY